MTDEQNPRIVAAILTTPSGGITLKRAATLSMSNEDGTKVNFDLDLAAFSLIGIMMHSIMPALQAKFRLRPDGVPGATVPDTLPEGFEG